MAAGLWLAPLVQAADVNITRDVESVQVLHEGKKVKIARNQDPMNTIAADFALTSRKCPPFCIQPSIIAPGVETVGELEVLDYLKKISDGDKNIIVVDSRTTDWVAKGTIPGSVNIPWNKLNIGRSDPITVTDILEKDFNARMEDGFWNYDNAKTVVLFCNGAWCGQSPINIKGLLKIGYPASKIKWYRGGMQDWEMLGLTTVKPAK
jgi:rhodanese-related sulfurtransferase